MKEHEENGEGHFFYEDVLGSRASMARVIIKELKAFRKEYAKPRKTLVENAAEAVYEEKKIEEMPVVVLMGPVRLCEDGG